MRDQDLFFGAAGWLVLILIIYNIIKDRKSIYKFLKNTIKYEWYKEPKNRKKKNRRK